MLSQTFLILGIIFITIGFSRMYFSKDNSKIIYRYIPRTFNEEQNNPVSLSQLYGSMFEGIQPDNSTFYNEKVEDARKLGAL
jgi:hypothetical protein